MKLPKWTHFVGIGGSGMSALAQILIENRFKVSGSDLKTSDATKRLEGLGAKIYIGHKKENLEEGVETVVISSAIPENNPEVREAYNRGIPVIKRAELLAKLMSFRKGIAVAGAHGKTTTTSMISLVLEKGGLDPTVIVGGEINDIGSNAKNGSGSYLVAEADESDGSFLLLKPHIAVVTNVEDDHLDHYGSINKIKSAFKKFINNIPDEGAAVLCIDDPFLKMIATDCSRKVLTYAYGEEIEADFVARNIISRNGGLKAEVWYKRKKLGDLKLIVPGRHNIQNALAAVAVGMELGLEFDIIANTLSTFRGVKRRFELLGENNGIKVIDDYAHHPTELKATLRAAKEHLSGRIIAVFQPHRYSRTRQLCREFGSAFQDADEVIITSIYSAGEEAIPGVTAEKIADIAKELSPGKTVLFLPEKDSVINYLNKNLHSGDIVLTLGAGDIWQVGAKLAGLQE